MANTETLEPITDGSESTASKGNSDTNDIIQEALTRYRSAITADSDERNLALDDVLFRDGKQWPDAILETRQNSEVHRPCLVINRIPTFIDQVVGDQKQNATNIKIKPYDDKSDPDTADKLEGLVRNIENNSNARSVYSWGFDGAVSSGRGFWRVLTNYIDDDSFDQEILIRRIGNAFSVVWDESAEDDMLEDAQFMFIQHKMKLSEYKRLWPGKASSALGGATGDNAGWFGADELRIAEYWRKVKRGTKTIYQLENGKTVETLKKGQKAVRTRKIDNIVIEWMIISGADVLEKPQVWPGKYIPIIPVWGKTTNVEGKYKHYGIVRFAKDSQRMYNYWRSSAAEQVALAPKAPWLLTSTMIGEHTPLWKQAMKGNLPYLLYEADPNAPTNRPIREDGAQIPTGLHAEAEYTVQEMKDCTGIHDATLGAKSNETSGEAIKQRRSGSDRINYTYHDNLSLSKAHTGKIILDLIPKIYDSARVVRILGLDGQENYMTINHDLDLTTGEPLEKVINMDEIGRYDVTVSTGPSYTTRREEAADMMMDLIKAYPEYGGLLIDKMVKFMDWPDSDDIVDRLMMALPPELREYIELKEEIGDKAAKDQMRATRKEAGMAQAQQAQGEGGGGEIQPQQEVDPAANIKVGQEQAKLDALELDYEIKKEELRRKKYEADEAETQAILAVKELQKPEPAPKPESKPETAGVPSL